MTLIRGAQIFTYALPSICASKHCLNSPNKGAAYCESCLQGVQAKAAAKRKAYVRYEAGRIAAARNAPPGHTWIYFMEAEGGRIKIGRARNLMARLGSIRAGSPVSVKVLVAFLAKPHVEDDLHRQFAACRIRGEWFTPDKQLVAFVESIKQRTIPSYIDGIYRTVDTGAVVIYHPS